MKNIRDRRKKLLDLMGQYSKIEKLSSELGITPESFVNIHEGKETITPELAQKIQELYDKENINGIKNVNDEEKKTPLIRNPRGKKIDPELGKRIDELWDSKFKNQDDEFIIGEEIQNKINNYEKLKFFEKKLAPRDFNFSLYGLQDIPNIPGCGEQIIIVDCNDGIEYPTNIQKNQESISNGLKLIWDKFNRHKILKPGDTIGIALDPENNHRIYVDFEYKDRYKLNQNKNQADNQKKENKEIEQYGETKMEDKTTENQIDIAIDELLLIEKNIVIRGPPGTGKTFEAIQVTERIAKNGENKDKLDKLKDEGYVNIVTFHDAYSYEAFIEGITFYTEEEGKPTDSLKPMCKPGILKEICKRALVSAIKFEKISDFVRLNKKDRRHVDEVLEDLLNMEFTWNEAYEEYEKAKSEGRVNFEFAPKFILIIDEINRGDVQKIFGDVITIIEKNKRLGEEEELTVELPNSRDIFGMPSNVYVIGTMNMVDRSINQIDAALSRRFGLVYKKPDFGIVDKYLSNIKEAEIHQFLSDSKDVLEKINERMCEEYSIGRDKQIGHSYLLGIKNGKDLIIAWKHKILPQIEDFCAGDTDKVNKILFKKEEDSNWIKRKEGILGFKDLLDYITFIENIKNS